MSAPPIAGSSSTGAIAPGPKPSSPDCRRPQANPETSLAATPLRTATTTASSCCCPTEPCTRTEGSSSPSTGRSTPRRRGTEKGGAVVISAFFIRRPIVAIVIAILTVMVGAVSLIGLPIAQFPQIIPPQIIMTTAFTGADAQTIEQSVATPIEQQVNGVDNMLYIQSTNANDGTMTQNVTFDVGTNIDIDNVLVQNRFSQAQTFLPQDVKNFGVTIKKSLAFPLIVVSLYSPDGRYDASFLTNYATININHALL